VLDHLDLAAIDVDALSVHTPDLDDVFLALTGRPAEDRNDTSTETQKETAR
jgi:ABC-2 type transport system ATP-binding protein